MRFRALGEQESFKFHHILPLTITPCPGSRLSIQRVKICPIMLGKHKKHVGGTLNYNQGDRACTRPQGAFRTLFLLIYEGKVNVCLSAQQPLIYQHYSLLLPLPEVLGLWLSNKLELSALWGEPLRGVSD